MDFKVGMMGDELRWISLVSSGDPVIHMWISIHHFLKWLTFRRPTLLFRDFDFATTTVFFFELTVPCFLSPAAFATCYAILVSTE